MESNRTLPDSSLHNTQNVCGNRVRAREQSHNQNITSDSISDNMSKRLCEWYDMYSITNLWSTKRIWNPYGYTDIRHREFVCDCMYKGATADYMEIHTHM